VFRAEPVLNGHRIASYQWNFDDGSFSTEPSPEHNFSRADTYHVTLTMRDICGGTVTRTQPVVIYPNMVPSFTAPGTVCSSETVDFIGAAIENGDTPAAWHWNFGNGSTATGQSVSYSYPQPGSYTATLTVTGTSGCSTSLSKTVQVKPGVDVNFTFEGTCFGDVTTFRDQSVVAESTTFVSREWRFGDGSVSVEQNPVHEYLTSGTYIVSLTIKTASGCDLTRSQTIRVKQLPRVAFSHALACSGEAVLFSDESTTNDDGLAAWQWDFGDPGSGAENASDARNPSHTFSQPGVYLVKLKATTSHGCRDSVQQRVTVMQSPRADFSFLAGCSDRKVTFTDASSAGPVAAIGNWYWELGDGSTSAEPNPVHVYEKAGTYQVALFITSSTRCVSVVRRTVTLYDPPVADFSFPAPYAQMCPSLSRMRARLLRATPLRVGNGISA
jgi:PKD repeat protein